MSEKRPPFLDKQDVLPARDPLAATFAPFVGIPPAPDWGAWAGTAARIPFIRPVNIYAHSYAHVLSMELIDLEPTNQPIIFAFLRK